MLIINTRVCLFIILLARVDHDLKSYSINYYGRRDSNSNFLQSKNLFHDDSYFTKPWKHDGPKNNYISLNIRERFKRVNNIVRYCIFSCAITDLVHSFSAFPESPVGKSAIDFPRIATPSISLYNSNNSLRIYLVITGTFSRVYS
jgi:hypothetical protein